MGFFDFLKPKQNPLKEMILQMNSKFFPNGQKDIDAATDAVSYILENKVSRDECQNIAVKSVAISRIAKEFSKERLKQHLAGYCLHCFNEKQIETLHGYLTFLTVADMMFQKSPSEIIRDGDSWLIPN